jgi:hypothetical protein
MSDKGHDSSGSISKSHASRAEALKHEKELKKKFAAKVAGKNLYKLSAEEISKLIKDIEIG